MSPKMSSGIRMEINEYEAVQCALPSEERRRNTYTEIIMLARLGVEALVSHLPLPAQIQHLEITKTTIKRKKHGAPSEVKKKSKRTKV
jgi:hypothetical protein